MSDDLDKAIGIVEMRRNSMLRLSTANPDDPDLNWAYSICHGEMNLLLHNLRSLKDPTT